MYMNQSDRCEHFQHFCPERSVSPAVYILLYVCSAAVVLLTVCGNLLVIISVLHFKQLHTPTNMLVLSLAVTDFLIGAFVMPPVFIWSLESCWNFGRGLCMCVMMIACFLMTLFIYDIVLIAIDRYLALSNPFIYMTRVTVRISCAAIAFEQCVLVFYNLALLYFNGNFMGFVICPGECFIVLNKLWFIIDLIYSFIFPLSVIIILYTRVFVIAKKHATAIRDLNNHTRPKTQKITSHSMKSERKAAKVLGILISVFLACLLPYFAYSLLGDVIQMPEETFPKVLIVFCLNSALNPLIYTLFYPWFRRCIKLIITMEIVQIDSALINVLS